MLGDELVAMILERRLQRVQAALSPEGLPDFTAGSGADLLLQGLEEGAGEVEQFILSRGEAGLEVVTCDPSPGMQPDVICRAEDLPFADALYGSAVYVPMSEGAEYAVSVSASVPVATFGQVPGAGQVRGGDQAVVAGADDGGVEHRGEATSSCDRRRAGAAPCSSSSVP